MYIISLSAGQEGRPAMAMLYPAVVRRGDVGRYIYQILFLEEEPNLSEPHILSRVCTLTHNPDLWEEKMVLVDRGAVGESLYASIAEEVEAVPVWIHDGAGTEHPERMHVARLDLLSAMEVLFDQHRITVSKKTSGWAALEGQLASVRSTYETDTRQSPTNLSMAVALCAWYADMSVGREVELRERENLSWDPLRFGLTHE